MKGYRFLGVAVLLLTAVGCGTAKPPPTGVVYEGKHTSEWGDIVSGSDRGSRLEAAKVLLRMGKEGQNAQPAIPGLQKALDDDDPLVRGWAAVALFYAVKGTPFPVGFMLGAKLKEAVESSDETLRAEAKEILERMPRDPAGPPGGPPGRRPAGDEKPAEEKKSPPNEGKE